MSTIEYQARRLVVRLGLAVFDEGCAVFCSKDDANAVLSLDSACFCKIEIVKV